MLEAGFDLIAAIQQIQSPFVDGLFKAITLLGGEAFYFLLLPFLYWAVDIGVGARVLILLLLSSYLNAGLKDLLQQPRPFEIDPGVKLADAGGYGLPSGHAQSSVIVWGSLGAWARKSWLWAAAVAVIVLIGLSRVYLGVHFPTDVVAGWAVGVLVLALYLIFRLRLERWLAARLPGTQVALSLVVPAVLLIIHPTAATTVSLGTLVGAGVGLAVNQRYIRILAGGDWRQRLGRFLVGGGVVGILLLGLGFVFPTEGMAGYEAFRFLRYGLVGVWVTAGAPLIFLLLRLSQRSAERN